MDNENRDGDISVRPPLVFISHDSRDAELAEAFSRLLSSVSAGVLKSFRSSDKKGNQGIEYGVEWYPEIMKKLESASDVVCLLTPNSVGRPWILYEAGVAKGKLETPVHGVALGIPLQNASMGPFAQFQNSDDSEDSLTQLVIQLVRRIPGAEPDRDVVKMQVIGFVTKAAELIGAGNALVEASSAKDDATSVAKIFEEVKVMFQDLPARIESRLDTDPSPRGVRGRKIPLRMMNEFIHGMSREVPPGAALIMAASQVRDDMPWLFEMAVDVYRRIGARDPGAMEALETLKKTALITMDHPISRDILFRSRSGGGYETEIIMRGMFDAIDRLAERPVSATKIRKMADDSEEQVRDGE